MSSNNFFLDIFNKLLKINEDNIMIIFDINGDIWFKFKDVLFVLGYSDIKHTISEMNIMKNNKIQYSNIKVVGSTPPPYNFQKNTMFINESGLYEVLSLSRKPLAKIFMNEYFTKIIVPLERIRSGFYPKLCRKYVNLDGI
jgi:prophage antirepressor-like protein